MLGGGLRQGGWQMDFCRLTEELWRVYLCGDAGEKQKMVSEWLDVDCVIIGTGAHEFYTNKQDFYKANFLAHRSTVQGTWQPPKRRISA